ncbi:MAG: hypothetical protein LUG18_12160 [Candidatus Azobacteroides sp.]|nr:hypothetical protein [Candidatus Azobacteroides sp.]
MYRNFFILSLCFFSILKSYGFELKSNQWYDFQGEIGTFPIIMSLYPDEDNTLTGYYCYKKHETRIPLKGKICGTEVYLTEYIDGKENGYFQGEFYTNERDGFTGEWRNKDQNRSYPVSLVLNSVVAGDSDRKYPDYFGTDNNIEEFMKRIKTSVLKDEKEWVANHIRYPISVDLNGKVEKVIRNKKEFISFYEQIFYPQFKEKLKEACVCNLFYNYQGVMLGRGEIWIDLKRNQPEDSYQLEIITINN